MDTVDIFSMKDVERLTGIKAHTIRVWERRYGIPDPRRTATNIRYYSNAEVRLLMTIRMLNGYGHKISAIAAMSEDERHRYLNEALQVGKGPRQAEESLLVSLLEADEARFTQVFYAEVSRLGLEQAFIQVLLPFFERVGILWQTGAIEPAREHFFFNLVRQKLIAGTDALGLVSEGSKPSVLLFLPEHELHELGLLLYNYAFRARGCRTYYLGQSVPFDGLERMLRQLRPDYIVTGMTNPINPVDFNEFYEKLQGIAGSAQTFYTGPQPARIKAEGKELRTTEDLIACLQSMTIQV